MDSSSIQVYDNHEECQSSESGWTLYLGSPQNDDVITQHHYDDDEDDDGVDYKNKPITNYDSGDSMASDASSRPSTKNNKATRQQQQQHYGKKKPSRVVNVMTKRDKIKASEEDKKGNKKRRAEMRKEK